MANRITMRFETIPQSGCFVCVSHRANQDGYLRKRWGNKIEMFHDFIYRAHHSLTEIPKGYEIHHTCDNRGCQNVAHMELVRREDHLKETNMTRFSYRKEGAHEHWINSPQITGTKLAEIFGVSFSIGCGWIREWKNESFI